MHYLRREDYHHHAALLCVQTKSTLAEPKISFETNEFFLRSSQEMADAFAEWPEAIASTVEIAERCDVEIELGRQLIPSYPTPDGSSEVELPARAGLATGCATATGIRSRPTATERAEYELGVIDRMGFNAYFLIVWDFVKYAKDTGIAVGPGPRLGGRLDRRLLRCRSPTSTRCATTCCSSASSTPSACRCPISTSTSRCAAASA